MYFARHRITTNKGFFPKGKSSSKKLKWMQFRSAISILVTSLAVSSSSQHRRHLPNVKHTENWTKKEPGSFRMSQHSHSKFIGVLCQWVSNRTFMPDRFAWKSLVCKRKTPILSDQFLLWTRGTGETEHLRWDSWWVLCCTGKQIRGVVASRYVEI